MGEWPAVIEGGRTAVTGELYEVDEALLLELDRYEDVPDLYLRAERVVGGAPTLIYVLRTEHGRGRPEITSGDWLRRS
jgi:gamma-glutamylcyclotransferase (GGCT)/AIG2-like uncharacterized protein YtfP